MGISRQHLQRIFKAATGLTPHQYRAARRLERLKAELQRGQDVTAALYTAGFNSPSRLYENARQVLGMTPGAYRQTCAANPLAVITPCHRVLRSDGALGGYHWGIERKQKLLEMESARPNPPAKPD